MRKEAVPIELHQSLIRLLDTLVVLDHLKDMKTSISQDFARYKRVSGANPPLEVLEELRALQGFLSSPDPRKLKGFILSTLREELQRVNGHEKALLDLVQLALSSLDPAEPFQQVLTQ